MDLNQIKVGETIHHSTGGNIADASEVILVDRIDVATFKLQRPGWNSVEHRIVLVQIVNGAQNEIEFVPVFLYPFASGRRMDGIIVEFDTGTNFEIRIVFAQAVDLGEINAFMISVMIREGEINQTKFSRLIRPRLQKLRKIPLDPVSLRMGMVIEPQHGVMEWWSVGVMRCA